MRSFKCIYHHDGEVLCEEYVQDSITYKLKLELEMTFYHLDDGEWITEYDFMLPMSRKLKLKMKMKKIVGDEVHYESSEIVDDMGWDEW